MTRCFTATRWPSSEVSDKKKKCLLTATAYVRCRPHTIALPLVKKKRTEKKGPVYLPHSNAVPLEPRHCHAHPTPDIAPLSLRSSPLSLSLSHTHTLLRSPCAPGFLAPHACCCHPCTSLSFLILFLLFFLHLPLQQLSLISCTKGD
jgi:hypothetical protein